MKKGRVRARKGIIYCERKGKHRGGGKVAKNRPCTGKRTFTATQTIDRAERNTVSVETCPRRFHGGERE